MTTDDETTAAERARDTLCYRIAEERFSGMSRKEAVSWLQCVWQACEAHYARERDDVHRLSLEVQTKLFSLTSELDEARTCLTAAQAAGTAAVLARREATLEVDALRREVEHLRSVIAKRDLEDEYAPQLVALGH